MTNYKTLKYPRDSAVYDREVREEATVKQELESKAQEDLKIMIFSSCSNKSTGERVEEADTEQEDVREMRLQAFRASHPCTLTSADPCGSWST